VGFFSSGEIMSVTSDLARLSLTIDRANELLLSDKIKTVDVGGGVQRPTNAKVMADFATQLGGAMPYTTVALGLVGTVSGALFSVLSSESDEYVIIYENVAGTAVEKDRYPNSEALKAQAALLSGTASEEEYLSIVSEEAEKIASLTQARFTTPAFEIATDAGATVIGDEEGGALLHADDNGVRLGPLEFKYTDLPGLYVVSEEGEILQDLSDPTPVAAPAVGQVVPFEGGVLFHPVIAVPEQGEVSIYVNNILSHRERAASVVAALGSMSLDTFFAGASEGQVLRLQASRFGSSAALHLRPADNPDSRLSMALKILKVPVQSPLVPINVLLIGDSIANRQGAQLLKAYLQVLGFAATMIGTLRGSANPADSDDFTGELGEAREGWETGDYTNAITDRSSPVAAGSEAAYLAMPKSTAKERNPFLRVATGGDSADIVRNGYVFDPAFYQSRFGLATPDIVINALGTNDVRDRPVETLADLVYANDTLFYTQIRAAWPNARIVRSLPGTAFTAARNTLWSTSYTPMIRAMKSAIATANSDKIYLAPTWALVSSEAGYPLPTGSSDIDGFIPGNFLNTIHPEGAGRHGLYEVLANYVAAAALSLH
jgi:lysophospholipase L1-like esterase